jgi:hypothetical protein
MISDKVLKQWIKNAIYLYNNGSDNQEYLRGQIELSIYLLGGSNDDEKLIKELYNSAKNTK